MKRPIVFAMLLAASQVVAAGQGGRVRTLALKDVRGRIVRLGDYKGKVVLLNFWATWCPPCRAEMPDLVKLQREYSKQGLQVVGVTYPPETVSRVRRFARRLGVNYAIMLGTRATKSLFANTDTLPVTVVIDRDGNIRDTIEGIMLPDEYEQKVKPLLRQPSA